MVNSRLDRCRSAIRRSALALMLAACHGAVAVAGGSGEGAAQPHLIDSGDHVHVLRVARVDSEDRVTVLIRIDDGYHVNANPATYPYLIPTSLVFKEIAAHTVIYPPATRFKPKFVADSIDVYQGTFTITAFFAEGGLAKAPILHATLTAQACTDVICLPPADILFPVHS